MRTLFSKHKINYSKNWSSKFFDLTLYKFLKNILLLQNEQNDTFAFFLMLAVNSAYKPNLQAKRNPQTKKRICFLTNRGKSVYVRFGNISRFSFKDLASFGYIPGIQKVW